MTQYGTYLLHQLAAPEFNILPVSNSPLLKKNARGKDTVILEQFNSAYMFRVSTEPFERDLWYIISKMIINEVDPSFLLHTTLSAKINISELDRENRDWSEIIEQTKPTCDVIENMYMSLLESTELII